uniref:30S ribosomal protein S15 n=1 Tax=Pseudomonas phage HRDY3 TaxID=3236930 RepID=A0AB39CDN7_9VIRU
MAQKKHWFHGKASNAKKQYIKKHPGSMYAMARSSAVEGSGAAAYRATVAHLREEIERLKKQYNQDHLSDSQLAVIGRQLQMAQRKLAQFKRAAMATARARKK